MIKNKAIFFDRDGTLIKTFVTKDLIPKAIKKIKNFRLLNHTRSVIKKLSQSYIIIVITNQPDVSRFKNKKINVIKINNKLSNILKIDKIYTCYSANDKNYMRKPNPGMIFSAKRKYKLNLKKSYVVGDRDKDIKAGKRAKCKTILLRKKYNDFRKIKPNFTIRNFKDLLNIIKV